MTTTDQPIRVKPAVRPPRELVSSTSFLLKRLGFAVKDRVHEDYEAAGASPFHLTVLAVLHDLPLAAHFFGRLVLLNHGRVVADGAPAEVLSPERIREVYEVDPRLVPALATGGSP